MNFSSLALSLSLISASAGVAAEPTRVLVELFTSEGCSSCPRADALLQQMVKAQPIDGVLLVPLELHVDYWDQLGWRDPFSSASFTARQAEYQQAFGKEGVYTPQMVVQGERGFVAGGGALRDAAEQARRRAAPGVSLTLARAAADELAFTAQTSASLSSSPGDVELWLALTEDGLQTQVPRGENAGKTLWHSGVARKLERLRLLLGPSSAAGHVRLPATGRKLRAVAFLQEQRSRRILRVAVLELGP